MEGDLQKSPQLGYPIDIGDVSGLSTILVATIQEAKDRISQIEYIFCSQLFPNFQSKYKSLQKIYSEARKAAEDAWKEKESDLLFQIEKVQLEKKMILEENQSLKLEKKKFVNREDPVPNKIYELQEELKQKTQELAEGREIQLKLLKSLETKTSAMVNSEKMMKELEEKNELVLKQHRSLELEAHTIREELLKKSKEVDEGMELQNKLLQLVQSKATLIVQKEKHLKEQEEKTSELLAKLEVLEKNVCTIQEQLSAKTNELAKAKDLQERLYKEIELHLLKNVTNEQLLSNYETENKLLTGRVLCLEESVGGLQKELTKKIEVVESGRKLQEQFLQPTDSNNSEMLKRQLEEHETEKKMLLAKIKRLEEKVDKLHVDLRERSNETSKGMELHGKLLQQIQAKDSELQFEKKKRRDMIAAYKSLKSQHNFLCAKFGLSKENMLTPIKMEDETNSSKQIHNPLTSLVVDDGNIVPNTLMVACEIPKEKENLENNRGEGLIQRSHSGSPSTSSSPVAPNCPSDVKPGPLAGTKRPVPSWRDTRSHQHQGGLDPHDDFLDTPLENIRGNMKKPTKEDVHDLQDPVQKDMNFDSSDDETQDGNGNPGPPKQQMSVPRQDMKGFKYVESVRKKLERENLKGIECKQCKKFYDAVLPDGGKNTDGNKQQLRCEHHDGVSRHRYRYAPPSTPEGFWNIGFESEM